MGETGLVLERSEGETWLAAALRVAAPYGLEEEVRDAYEGFIKNGDSEEDAAWGACYEWDILSPCFV